MLGDMARHGDDGRVIYELSSFKTHYGQAELPRGSILVICVIGFYEYLRAMNRIGRDTYGLDEAKAG